MRDTASGRLAYLMSVAGETPDPITDVFTVNGDGSDSRRVTHDEVDAYTLEWSPDGRRFVYSTNPHRIGESAIWTMRENGTNRRRLTRNRGSVRAVDPDWSPDGRKIVYELFDKRAGLGRGLFVMDANGLHKRRLTSKDDRFLSWSTNGRSIAFVRTVLPNPRAFNRPELWIVDSDGTDARRLRPYPLKHDDGIALAPNWRRLAIFRKSDRDSGPRYELLLMNFDGRNRRSVGGAESANSSWSPNSRRIAYERDNGIAWGEAIWTASAEGRNRQRLIAQGGGPQWAPDSRRIAYHAERGLLVRDASNLHLLLKAPYPGEVTNIRWAPTTR